MKIQYKSFSFEISIWLFVAALVMYLLVLCGQGLTYLEETRRAAVFECSKTNDIKVCDAIRNI